MSDEQNIVADVANDSVNSDWDAVKDAASDQPDYMKEPTVEATDPEAAVAFYNAAREALPENFRTPEAFVKSYREAQAKMNQETQRRQQLEQELAQYQSVFADAEHLAVEDQINTAAATNDWRATLAFTAEQADAATRQALGLPDQAQAAANTERQTLHAAWSLAENTLGPDVWAEVLPGVEERIRENPEWLGSALASGDPSQIASGLVNTAAAVRQAKNMHAMKMNAMGIPGAGGRPPARSEADEAWQAIVDAAKNTPGRYW